MQKIVDVSQKALLLAGGGAAVSNDNDALEPSLCDPEFSEAEDQADASAGIISLKVGGDALARGRSSKLS